MSRPASCREGASLTIRERSPSSVDNDHMATVSLQVRQPSTFCLGLFFAFIGAACLYLGSCELRLRLDGVTTTATVVDTRETGGRSPSFQVRYHFEVKPYGWVYSFSDPIRGRDSYAPMTFEAWKQAKASGRVPILYEFDNPWNNRPVQSQALNSSVAFWLIAASFMLLAALWLFRRSIDRPIWFTRGASLETSSSVSLQVSAGRIKTTESNLNGSALAAFEQAGFQVEGDALVIEVGSNVEVRANGLSHLLQTCHEQKLDPLKLVATILDTVRNQPAVKAAMQWPALAKCKINISLNDVRTRRVA